MPGAKNGNQNSVFWQRDGILEAKRVTRLWAEYSLTGKYPHAKQDQEGIDTLIAWINDAGLCKDCKLVFHAVYIRDLYAGQDVSSYHKRVNGKLFGDNYWPRAVQAFFHQLERAWLYDLSKILIKR